MKLAIVTAANISSVILCMIISGVAAYCSNNHVNVYNHAAYHLQNNIHHKNNMIMRFTSSRSRSITALSLSYLESISASVAPPSTASPPMATSAAYLDSLSNADATSSTSITGAGTSADVDAAPYLSTVAAVSEVVCGVEPTVECADAVADYLEVVAAEEDGSVSSSVLLTDEEKELQDRYLKMVSTEVDVKRLLGENTYSLTDLPVGVMLGRLLDNLEDSAQINDGKKKGMSKRKGKDQPAEERPTVVVLGTGWASHAFIKLASTYDLRVVVVSPVNHFVFTPMLASAAVGTIEYRSMTEPIRITNPYMDNFVEGRAIGVNVLDKKVTVQLTSLGTVMGTFQGVASSDTCRLEPDPAPAEDSNCAAEVIELNYDYLLCAVGTSVRSNIVPGAKEHCFNLKTSQDSKRLRTAIGESLEFASRPDVKEFYYTDPEQQALAKQERRRRVRFVVVGGGPTGVELAGELSDFISQICSSPNGAYQQLADDISITLVHGGSELLPAMDQELRQLALTALKLQGVEVRLNTRLKEVGRDYVVLGEKGSDEIEKIPVGLTVWAAGNAPVPFVQELLSQLPESAAGTGGRINVDRWLRCPTPTPETFGSVLVLGDVARLESEPGEYESDDLPQTAQVAGQQGSFAARMLNRKYDLQQTPPKLKDESEMSEYSDRTSRMRIWLAARGLEECPEFTFLSLGLLAYIGGGEALNQVELGPVPIFNYAGKIAFLLWRSVYLTKQAATRNQALIAFDWLRTEAFGRDITRL